MIMIHGFEFLQAKNDRESFFRLIARIYPTLSFEYRLIAKAYNDNKDAFRDRKREGGERYFEHIRAVVLILILYLRITDYKLIVAALLHDIVEDIPSWTLERVRQEYSEEIAAMVEWLTKPPKDEPDRERIYHSRFERAARWFFLIKLADRLHNLMTLDSCSKEKKARKIRETEIHYHPYAEKHQILIQPMEEVLAILKAA